MKSQSQIKTIVDEIFTLYALHGNEDYIGEPVSQIEHMCQSAQLAERAGYDDEVILAAFFHDIGHICTKGTEETNMGGYGVMRHEKVGADYLRKKGFSEKIALLIENHVQAKRYLTYKYPEYFQKLSEASIKTLGYQGGPMTAAEATAFENHELFEQSIKMREWDELAKETNTPLPDLTYLKEKSIKHLEGIEV